MLAPFSKSKWMPPGREVAWMEVDRGLRGLLGVEDSFPYAEALRLIPPL
jgi:hypothetical protein